MVRLPATRFRTPRYNDSFPSRAVQVTGCWIDRTEVTNAMYAEFVKATGYQPPESWQTGRYVEGADKRPVTGVSFVDAQFYCAWRGARLPTDDEWHLAAGVDDGRRYPWGKTPNNAAFAVDVPPGDVGRFSNAAGRNGVHDIVGNAWEWSCTPLRRDADQGIVQGQSLLFGGGTLSLNDCPFFTTSDDKRSIFGNLSGPVMMFWDERDGLPGGFNSKMWGATITSREFAYFTSGGGYITVGTGGSFAKSYPGVCLLLGDLSLRCESVGFRCAAD